MKTKENQPNKPNRRRINDGKKSLPGYPLYPPDEDIFIKSKEEKSINPEDTSQRKEPDENVNTGKYNEKDFADDASGSDLDVPGSELDDEQESIGSEDEENNYYSIGGDDHSSLDENTGD